MKRKQKYNDDFKKTVVKLYYTGSPVSALRSEYGVSEVTMYKWIKSLPPTSEETGSLTPKNIVAIQKENHRMKQEIEIKLLRLALFSRNKRKLKYVISEYR